MSGAKPVWLRREAEALAHEISRLAIACDIPFGEPGIAERVLHNDDTVCGCRNPAAFRKLRQHLMALFGVEKKTLDNFGAQELREMVDEVRSAVMALRASGSTGGQTPDR